MSAGDVAANTACDVAYRLAVDIAVSLTGHIDSLPVVAGAVLGSQPQDVRRKG
jgi:hypothetical protein